MAKVSKDTALDNFVAEQAGLEVFEEKISLVGENPTCYVPVLWCEGLWAHDVRLRPCMT